jgi:hypothetical protein
VSLRVDKNLFKTNPLGAITSMKPIKSINGSVESFDKVTPTNAIAAYTSRSTKAPQLAKYAAVYLAISAELKRPARNIKPIVIL